MLRLVTILTDIWKMLVKLVTKSISFVVAIVTNFGEFSKTSVKFVAKMKPAWVSVESLS